MPTYYDSKDIPRYQHGIPAPNPGWPLEKDSRKGVRHLQSEKKLAAGRLDQPGRRVSDGRYPFYLEPGTLSE
tara:strand:- start:460 stop:675 length:216 start_codon:yes stop_codon:yes gene_type:complete